MGAPIPEMVPVENASAEALLSSLPTVSATERRKHASVFNYWLSIRGEREFAPIRDLDPLEISDAGPWSVLLEMIGGGEDAVVRHLGQAIKADIDVEKIGDAPRPSLLSCIHGKLPIVAACKQAFAFEEEFDTDDGSRRCWVSLLPFSVNGTWIDYVYGFVSLDGAPAVEELIAEEPTEGFADTQSSGLETQDPSTVPLRPFFEEAAPLDEAGDPANAPPEAFQPLPGGEIEAEAESTPEPELVAQFDEPLAGDEASEWQDPTEPCEAVYDEETVSEYAAEPEAAPDPATKDSPTRPGFSAKLFEKLGNVAGFYGQGIEVPPFALPDLAAETDTGEFIAVVEGSLHSKLSEVRAKADEVRVAQLRSIAALHEGLSAAYDFALDAEQQPEEYLKLVEAQGLKIQLRAPMKPVVKLAFDGLCDEETITRLEAILAWALKMELPRGSLAERLEAEGGIEPILEGLGKAA